MRDRSPTGNTNTDNIRFSRNGAIISGILTIIYSAPLYLAEEEPKTTLLLKATFTAFTLASGSAFAGFSFNLALDTFRPEANVFGRTGPSRPPRLDYDVNTGLPNHRATPESASHLLADEQESKELRVTPLGGVVMDRIMDLEFIGDPKPAPENPYMP